MEMKPFSTNPMNLSGQLLVAHPSLRDPNFRRRVVWIASHSPDEGAHGVIVNWPLGENLKRTELSAGYGELAGIPLYRGGPVSADQVILSSWNWKKEAEVFQFAFGIGPDRARDLILSGEGEVRAYLGYAGWGEGQLEEELEQDSWLVAAFDGDLLQKESGIGLWRRIVAGFGAEMRLFAEAPEDPSVN